MRPFNLEEAKAGTPICDAGGRTVKFIAHVPEALYFNSRVVVLIDGLVTNVPETNNGLYMKPSKRPVWITIYKDYTTKINDGFNVEIHMNETDSLGLKRFLGDRHSNIKIYDSIQIDLED